MKILKNILMLALTLVPAMALCGSIRIDGSKDDVLDALYEAMLEDEWRLVEDGRRLLVFEKDPTGIAGFFEGVFSGSKYDSKPVYRASFSAAGRGGAVTLHSTIEVVTNPGSAFERRNDRGGGHEDSLLWYVKSIVEGRPVWSRLQFSAYAPIEDDSVGVKTDVDTGRRFCSTSQRWVKAEGESEDKAMVFYACTPAQSGCLGNVHLAFKEYCSQCKHTMKLGRKRFRERGLEWWSGNLAQAGKLYNALYGAGEGDILHVERKTGRKVLSRFEIPVQHVGNEIRDVKNECGHLDLRVADEPEEVEVGSGAGSLPPISD